MARIAGLNDWQWIFLLEGLPIIPLGIVTYIFLSSIPDTVQCKNKEENMTISFTFSNRVE